MNIRIKKSSSPSTCLLLSGILGCLLVSLSPRFPAAAQSSEAKRIFSRAVKLQEAGNWELAADSWRSYLEEAPHASLAEKARFYLGVALLEQSLPEEALRIFEDLLTQLEPLPENTGETPPSTEGAHDPPWDPASEALRHEPLFLAALSARRLAEKTDSPESRKEYLQSGARRLTRLIDQEQPSPLHAAALYWRGRLQAELGQSQEAREDFNRALVDLEDVRLKHLSVEKTLGAKAFLDLENFAEALQEDAYRRLARLESESHPASAIETWREYLERFPEAENRGEIHRILAHLLLKTDRPEEALQAVREAKPLLPENERNDLRWFEAEALALLERFEEAADLLRAYLEKETNPRRRHRAERLLAQVLTDAGRHEEAEPIWERLFESDRSAPTTVRKLVDCLLAQGKEGEVAVHLDPQIARSEDPFETTFLRFEKARAFQSSPRRRKEAVTAFGRLATQSPKHPLADDALYQAIHAAVATGQYSAALGFARRLETEYPDSPFFEDALFLGGESALQLFLMTEARRYYQRLLDLFPSSPRVPLWHLRLARTWFMQKQWKKVLDQLARIPEEKKKQATLSRDVEKHYLRGCALLAQEHPKEAASAFQKAWNLAAKTETASHTRDRLLFQLAQAYQSMEETTKARETLALLMERFPQSPLYDQARFQSADLLRRGGEHSAAREALEAMLEEALPRKIHVSVLIALAKMELVRGDPEKAVAHLDRAFRIAPQSPRAATLHYLRSLARLKILDLRSDDETNSLSEQEYRQTCEEALTDIRQALATHLEPDDRHDALLQLGECLWRLRRYEEAAGTIRTLLDEAPDYPYAEEALVLLGSSLIRGRKIDEGMIIVAQLEKRFPDSDAVGKLLTALGENALQQEEYPLAVDLLAQAEEHLPAGSPLRAEALFLRGAARFEQEDYEAAFRLFQRCTSRFPDAPKTLAAMWMQIECAFQMEQYEQALERLEAIPTDDLSERQRFRLRRDTARAAADLEDWDRVIAAMQNLLEDDPPANFAHPGRFQMARAHQEKGEIDQARTLYETVFQQAEEPLSLRAGLEIGYLHLSRRETSDAAEVLLQVGNGEGHPALRAEALFLAGRALEQGGETKRAQEVFRRLMEKFPESPESKEARKLLQNNDL